MALAESWHIKSRAHECAVTGRAFHEGETIFSALFPGEDGGFERRDFSLEGWDQREPDALPAAFSSWRSTYQSPTHEEKPEVVARESAEDLLRRLVEEDEEATENVRYILAVMLERQKLLRETDQQRTTNGILRIYEHRKSGDVLIIRDPDIPLDQVERIQQDVVAMLESGGQAQESAETAETTEAPEPAEPTASSPPEDGDARPDPD